MEDESKMPEVNVQPGESHLVLEPSILRTVLGSCVGITFWIPRVGMGALCHPMLPKLPQKNASSTSISAGRRYVDYAIRDLAQHFDSCHVRRGEIEVKLFGGGDVLMVANESSRPTVGQMNCAAALRVLSEEGLTVSAQSLGGTCGLHIQFNTGTGEVLLQRLGQTTGI